MNQRVEDENDELMNTFSYPSPEAGAAGGGGVARRQAGGYTEDAKDAGSKAGTSEVDALVVQQAQVEQDDNE
ncbi:unnamed protein product, partial [Amoebophrya sp. A25]|eukprot:GSA25T00020453001.1